MCDKCIKEPPSGKNETLMPGVQAMASKKVFEQIESCTDKKECPQECRRITTGVQWRRLNTAYVDERSNWLFSCKECYEGVVEQYEENWADYYSGRL